MDSPSKHPVRQSAETVGVTNTKSTSGVPRNVTWLVLGVAGGLVLMAILVSGYMAIATDGSLPSIACSFFGVLLVGLFVVVPIVLIVVLVKTLSNSADKNSKSLYETFANSVNGRVFMHKRVWWRQYYTVEFFYRECRVLVFSEVRRGGDHYDEYACFTIDLPRETSLQCKISPQHALDLGRVFGGQDLVLGWPAFDDAFRVRTNNEPLALRLLDTMLQQHMLRFQEFGKTIRTNVLENGRAYLDIERQYVKVCIKGVISKETEIFEFFRLCRGMSDHLVPRLS